MNKEWAVASGNSIGAAVRGGLRAVGVGRENSVKGGEATGYAFGLFGRVTGFKGGAGKPHKGGQNKIEPVTTGKERQVGGPVWPPSFDR